VRANSYEDARSRVSKSLSLRKKPVLREDNARVICTPSKLEHADLGLKKDLHELILRSCTGIIHVSRASMKIRTRANHISQAAWPVNFSLSLNSIAPQFAGLQNLINLSLISSTQPPVLFCSSTASILGPSHPSSLAEIISTDPADSDSLGYSRSKWVAESICANAAKAGCKAEVLRIGQLTGDTQNGIWNMSEAYPMMLSTVKDLGCLPKLDEDLTWLPVDVAAKAVVDILFRSREEGAVEESPVFHITNNNRSSRWTDLLSWSRKLTPFKIVELKEWLGKLEKLENHPARNLAWLWKKNVESGAEEEKEGKTQITFETKNAEKVSEAMRNVGAVDEKLVRKIWMWLEKEIGVEKDVRSKL
jgi:thioester reductase-like protein